MSVTRDESVIVVGAGIVGLCVAHELGKAGYRVEVIDPAEPGSQCSSGNAGAISAGSVAPLAMPGVIKSAFKMFLDPDSPLHVPMHYWLHAAPWFTRFIAAASPQRVGQIADALSGLFTDAVENHMALAREIGCPERVVKSGQLHLYVDEAALAKDAGSWRLRESRGVKLEMLDAAAIREMEPAVSERYRLGVFMPEQAAVTEPLRYAQAIAAAVRERGGKIIRDKATALVPQQGGWQVQGEQGRYQADRIVLAAGAWSGGLLRPLGWHVPLESQRGYHLDVTEPGVRITRPVVLSDRKIFMVPLETGLRIAGTVEFGGLAMPPTERRALALGEHAKEGVPGLQLGAQPSMWMGHRPCMPDSMPVLGPVPQHEGLWCAFGHGHLGVTGSINTGRLIAGAFRGEVGLQRFAPFSITRFR
ncbi:NAD(P)/FAD-dependent oxidoreductase [Noviherbaspirillum massiliense]|uniref:NAD(P)/FAD-dependent oxidoreductase n=1 Tax=Noviherbaspirillum massiliense TaxID=1465823 RepID=UPI0002EF9E15|nr:FAD-dependent oxidoreductase [Noviherbaspirillum massiliense]